MPVKPSFYGFFPYFLPIQAAFRISVRLLAAASLPGYARLVGIL
jgi:hypothetical protein